jgi:hypothetical protein
MFEDKLKQKGICGEFFVHFTECVEIPESGNLSREVFGKSSNCLEIQCISIGDG